MAHQSSDAGAGPITGINITPMVDIVLVLLIIFMITAKLIADHRALQVELPRAATSTAAVRDFLVTLSSGGVLHVGGERMDSEARFLARARRAKAEGGNLRATIEADRNVPHGRVMQVLDLLRQAGIARVGFAVVPSAVNAADR